MKPRNIIKELLKEAEKNYISMYKIAGIAGETIEEQAAREREKQMLRYKIYMDMYINNRDNAEYSCDEYLKNGTITTYMEDSTTELWEKYESLVLREAGE